MANCYDGMRAALRRNIEGLAHLSADQKEALLESQMGMAIAASESGRPFVEIYGPPEVEDAVDVEYDAETPAETRAPRRAPARAVKR